MTLYLGEHLSFCSAVPIFYRWLTPFYQQMFKQQRRERMLALLSYNFKRHTHCSSAQICFSQSNSFDKAGVVQHLKAPVSIWKSLEG